MLISGVKCVVCGTNEFKWYVVKPTRTMMTSDSPNVAAQLAAKGLDKLIEHSGPYNVATCERDHKTEF